MKPPVEAVNFTPTSIAWLSPLSITAGVAVRAPQAVAGGDHAGGRGGKRAGGRAGQGVAGSVLHAAGASHDVDRVGRVAGQAPVGASVTVLLAALYETVVGTVARRRCVR